MLNKLSTKFEVNIKWDTKPSTGPLLKTSNVSVFAGVCVLQQGKKLSQGGHTPVY